MTASVSVREPSASRRAGLALYGGPAIRSALLPYGHHEMTQEDIDAVVQALRSGWLTTGPKVAEFEEAVAASVGARYAVALSSGTAALHAAVFAAGLGPGDEAITTPLTFCATANCLLYQGARPIFADVLPETLTIDPQEITRRLTTRTKAILPVDYAGHPADLDAIRALADQHGLMIIEDACHALGAEYQGKRVGSVSRMTAFSFHPVKQVTTGEGGMVTTDDAKLADRLRLFRNHGIASDPRKRQAEGTWDYEMVALGYNYRLTDLGCALGLSQLRRLTTTLARRRAIARRYTDVLRTIPGLQVPTERPQVTSSWHLYPIRIDPGRLQATRAEVLRALRAENIGVNVHFAPVHLHPYYRHRFGYHGGEYPVAEEASERLITIPLFHGMTDRDVDDVLAAVRKVFHYFLR